MERGEGTKEGKKEGDRRGGRGEVGRGEGMSVRRRREGSIKRREKYKTNNFLKITIKTERRKQKQK